jgi:peptidoglycan/xylan/chitin deacetylase (PgdA/CDA1 family)
MYHSISENRYDPHAVPLTEFRSQMHSLRDFRVISLEEGLQLLRSKRPLKKTWVITFDDALLDFYSNALPVLREFGYPVTMFVPTGLVGKCAEWDSFDKSKPLMAWAQLEECQKYNVSFGSHTINHVRLDQCGDKMLKDELSVSLQMLRDKLEHVLPALAYPGGYHDIRVRQAAQSEGYSCGLGASSRWGNGHQSDFFQLRREKSSHGNFGSWNSGGFLS